MRRLADRLVNLCKTAQNDVFIASPFIKLSALRRVVHALPPDITLTVIVRFAPMDLVTGATDSEIVGDLLSRPKTRVFSQPSLHAKLYRIDEKALLGSANLTNKGLGWSLGANIELLIEVPATHEDVRSVEELLRETAYPLTPEIVASIVAALPSGPLHVEGEGEGQIVWVPSCRRPAFLWEIYSTGDANAITSVVAAGKRDILLLELPEHLPEKVFRQALAAAFKASHFYQLLDHRLGQGGLSDAAASDWLSLHFAKDMTETSADTWLAVKEWLREFSPGSFHFGQYTETLVKAQLLK